jgi:hypothetical protein
MIEVAVRSDYKVLQSVVNDELCGEDLLADYLAQGCDGVSLRLGAGTRLQNLEFAGDLPGLQYLEITGRVLDDTKAFVVSGLQEVVLRTRCKRPVPTEVAASLRRAAVDTRPGLANLAGLEALTVWGWKETHLDFLTSARKLTSLDVEGQGQLLSLDALAAADRLMHLQLNGVGVTDLSPLRHMKHLRELLLAGTIDAGASSLLDLEAVREASGLRLLTLTYGGYIKSAKPLMGFPELTAVRLRGTPILDGDLDALEAKGVLVVRPEE